MRERGAASGCVASFAPTLASMPPEFPRDVPLRPRSPKARSKRSTAAMLRGTTIASRCAPPKPRVPLAASVIALAQFSLARGARRGRRATGLPVLTTPDSAVRALRQRLGLNAP